MTDYEQNDKMLLVKTTLANKGERCVNQVLQYTLKWKTDALENRITKVECENRTNRLLIALHETKWNGDAAKLQEIVTRIEQTL